MSDHVSYLEAKRPLDDRSLDRDVLSTFVDALPASPTVLEAGCGTATMPERLFEWGLLDAGTWVAVDSHAAAVTAGRDRLAGRPDATRDGDTVSLGDLTVEFVVADVFEHIGSSRRRFDAVVGNAFFDIVDIERALSTFRSCTDLVYAPITYNGETTVAPPMEPDEQVFARYEEHMRSYRPGHPEAARRLRAALAEPLADAASPWRIVPPYTAAERTVLRHLIETIRTAVGETGLDADAWARQRRAQIADGRLRYEAANRDVLGRI